MDDGLAVRHDIAGQRFVAALDGVEAVLEYRAAGEAVMEFVSTWVPEALRRRGVGTRLACAALDHAGAAGWRVIPSCWFVREMIARHPEYEKLLVK
jgi:predicted GNAT family acetyltransferase